MHHPVKGPSVSMILSITVLGIVLLGLFFRQSNAQGACTITVTSLPVTLSQSGAVYCLDRNLTNVTSGISITADNVTFDGQGHSIAFIPNGSGDMPNVFSIDHHDYVTMRDFSFTGTGRVIAKTIQFADAHHNTIDAVTGILTNGSNGVSDSLTFMVFFESYGNTVRNSTFMVQYAPDGPAINAGRILYLRNDSAYNTFENNTFVSMDHGSSYALEMGSGSWGTVHQNTFRGNRIYANEGTAILMPSNGGHNLFERNLIYSAAGDGMAVGASPGNINELYNNTIVTPDGKGYVSQTNSTNPTHIFKNNIFVSGNTFVFDVHISTLTSDYNDLFHAAGNSFIWYDTSSYTNLANWKTTGRDAHSVSVAPNFVNSTVNLASYPPALGDFHLSPSGNATLLGSGENGVDMGAFPRDRSCTENWTCDSFSACETASQGQYRVCHDTNYCSTTISRPVLAQTCSGSCIESWSCGTWSTCVNNSQTRTCTDANSCGTTVDRPALTQSCVVACTESWSCGAWGACSGGVQSRTCGDDNSCGTTTSRPPLNQSCDSTPPAAVQDLILR